MRQLRAVLVVCFVGWLTLVVAPPTSAGESTHAVRVPAAAVADVNRLGLGSHVELAYGGFHWLLLDTHQLGLLNASGLPHTMVAEAGTVRVPGFAFDPLVDGEPSLPRALKAAPGSGLRLVQLVGPVRDEWVEQLDRLGINLLQYYPHNTYLVWASLEQLQRAALLSFVRWHGAFEPGYKVNADLVGRAGTIRNVDVMFFNDGDVDGTLAALAGLGARLLQRYPSQPDRMFFDAIVELDADAIENVALLPTVLWLGYESTAPTLDDEMSAQILAGNHPGGVPVTGYLAHLSTLGVNGAGVIWATIDDGVDWDHPDFAGRIVGGHDFPGGCSVAGQPGSDCAGNGHGTHVTGIIGGTGAAGYTDPAGFYYGLGMAPGYSIFAMNSLSASSWPPSGGWQEHSKQAVLGNAIGGNNSWTTSEGTNHGYQASERTHDLMVRDGNFDTAAVAEPFIEVFSAGNSGPGSYTLTAPKEAKNLIVTAGSQNYRVSSNINAMYSSSSRGPAADGRYVPTITTPGEQIASTRSSNSPSLCGTAISGTNNYYSYCTGTSMASPHTSGSVILATEWWRSFNSGANPSPAMAKALLVNGAVDMGTADIPNFNEGWGRVNITKVIAPGVARVYRDQVVTFTASGQSEVYTWGVADSGQPLKVTLAWSDAAGAVGANPALVNNLDLTVETNGLTYKGNVFSGGWSTTGGTADTKNNLENVYVAAPGSSVVITVAATAVNGDGVPYNGDTSDQDFVLVCTNCIEQADFTIDATPAIVEACAPADATYTVDIGQLLGFANPVDLAAAGNPAGTTIGFSVDPVTPPGQSTLTIGNTGAAGAGSYPIQVSGTSTTGTKTADVTLNLSTASPGAAILLSPVDGATNQPARPDFQWSAATQGTSYSLQVATEPGFSAPVVDQTNIVGTTFTPGADLGTSTQYYWRVAASNGCGTGAWSSVFTFATVALPGDCGLGSTPVTEFSDDFESGAPGWTHSAGSGTDTWSLRVAPAPVHSGTYAWVAEDVLTVSDQRLVSPSVTLPSGASPLTLQFWNRQEMEDRTGGCYDGGIVEISSNGGSTWTQLLDPVLLTDPYDGPVYSSNPLYPDDAWCGDPQDWLRSIVDVDAYAGQTVSFRFRIGTDGSVGRTYGWSIDDVKVQSCQTVAGADLAVSKDDGTTTTVAGATVTYTITVTNSGPLTATGASVADPFPASLGSVSWSCAPSGGATCTASGAGSIADTVNLPPGGSLVYTATGTVAPDASGTLVNTATVTPPGGLTDPVPANNMATDTDTIAIAADLAVTMTDGRCYVLPGESTTYTILVSNVGPSSVTGATVVDAFPAALTGVSWTCTPGGGGSCPASGFGDIGGTVDLPVGAELAYSATGTVAAGSSGQLHNSFTITVPAGASDPLPGNNTASDLDALELPLFCDDFESGSTGSWTSTVP